MRKIKFKRATSAAAAMGLAVAVGACTPATGDMLTATGGAGQALPGSGGSPGSTATGGSTGVGSGGTGAGSGGMGAGNPVGSGGVSPVGGSPGTGGIPAGGAGGKVAAATGGSPGSGGVGGSAAVGCNWIHSPDDTWKFGTPAPADKIVLFDGTTKSVWHKQQQPTTPIDWTLQPDGTLRVVPSGTGQATEIQSNMKFEDVCVHVEYMTPPPPYRVPTDVQTWGNSGVYLRSAYEMQILDTHALGPLNDGCGAVYKESPPKTVACYMYGLWNTYEIEFKSPVWSGTAVSQPAVFVRVALNGKLVQEMFVVTASKTVSKTDAGIADSPGPQPLGLQDHLDYVSFRNIWATIPRY